MLNDFETVYKFPKSIEEIDEMGGKEFETFLFHYYKQKGYQVSLTDDTADRGIDINVTFISNTNQKTRIGIQAKRWKTNVGHAEIVAMLSGKDYYNCDKLMLVTTSGLTGQAHNTALNNDIAIKTREDIIEMLNEINKSKKVHESKNIKEEKLHLPEQNNNTTIDIDKNLSELLFEELKILRNDLAKKHKIYPNYLIYNNQTIDDIIKIMPLTLEDLHNIKGIGSKKIDLFGNDILVSIQSTCFVFFENEVKHLKKTRDKIAKYNSIETPFDNTALLALILQKPKSTEDLKNIPHFPKEYIEIFGKYLIKQLPNT